MNSILLIDDKPELLSPLRQRIIDLSISNEIDVITWTPQSSDIVQGEGGVNALRAKFQSMINGETVLVVTDHDLTSKGLTGLFGSSIVQWAQAEFIPVGDFSLGNPGAISKEPNHFEIRVPVTDGETANYILAVFRGFRDIRRLLMEMQDKDSKRSPAAVIASILRRPKLESKLALYNLRPSAANAELFDGIHKGNTNNVRDKLLAYVVGHFLLNSVLKYPGILLKDEAFAAYLAIDCGQVNEVAHIFSRALYAGPFKDLGRFYWASDVDEIIDSLSSKHGLDEVEYENFGAQNRAVVEAELGRALVRHSCARCNGEFGGFWCPMTRKTVCDHSNCSVSSNSWIPPGAKVCRIEIEFYEEWAPLLGL